MDIETAFKEIDKWHDGESYSIVGLTSKPVGSSELFEQSDVFISVVGCQYSIGDSGDSFEGEIYFEYEAGKFIKTVFYC